MTESLLPGLAGIGLAIVACQWLAWKLRLPAILFLLLCGLLLGPIAGLLEPDVLFGPLLFPLVSIAVAIILFEGSLTLRFSDIRGLGQVVRNRVTVGAVATWWLMALAAMALFELQLDFALLFGAIMVVTGPTVIIPILRTVRPNRNIAGILRWEGIVIDPIGALLAVVVFDFMIARQSVPGSALLVFGGIVVTGALLGLGIGYLTGGLLRKSQLPGYLHSPFVLMVVIAVFALSDYMEPESGLLAVTVMGMTLANMPGVHLEDIRHFKENLSLLLLSALFIVLAARIDPAVFQTLDWWALVLLTAAVFPVRAVVTLLCTWGSGLTAGERGLLAWVAPRGIVAAAVSAVFALKLEEIGHPAATLLVPMTLAVIIVTVLVQGFTTGWLARRLGVAEPAPDGALILGAHPVARMIGKALQAQGLPVMLVDSNWDHVRQARMQGLPVYYGSPVSPHADETLETSGLGYLLARSGRPHLDALTALRFRREFGPDHVYGLKAAPLYSGPVAAVDAKHDVSEQHRGRRLFNADTTLEELAFRLQRGAEVRTTGLTEEFDMQDFLQRNPDTLPRFAMDTGGHLQVYSPDRAINVAAGWKLISLSRALPS